jgi:hypothetical protein
MFDGANRDFLPRGTGHCNVCAFLLRKGACISRNPISSTGNPGKPRDLRFYGPLLEMSSEEAVSASRPVGPTARRQPSPQGWDIDSPTLSERRTRGTLFTSTCISTLSVRQGSWRVPVGASPVQVRLSGCLVVSVAWWKVTTTAKRTQQWCGVGN